MSEPYKPSKQEGDSMYPPPPYAAAIGVPVAAPAPHPQQQQQQQQYAQQQYAQQQQPPMHVDQYGRPIQVDQYGRPIVAAVPMHVTTHIVANNANIQRDAQGNALCKKCSSPYPLPAGCTSWRCRNCGELNNASVYGDECCTIL